MKSIYDFKHVNGVKAVALLKDGKEAGKIIANFSDNPAGSVCTVAVILYTHTPGTSAMGSAGGYGYDKFSSAVYEALKKMDLIPGKITLGEYPCKKSGKIAVYPGSGNTQRAFENAGYQYIEVI